MPNYQLSLFDENYLDTINQHTNRELPALLQPVYHTWDCYNEGSIEDIYDRM